jgi:hypothetical protein
VSGHKFKIGQLVNYRGRDRASGVYQVTQLLAVESYGMSFDYNAPAELFLAKRTRSSRENYRRFATAAEAIRYAAETCARPSSGRVAAGWRPALQQHRKSSACTKPLIIRCASLSERPAPAVATSMGPPPATNLRQNDPTPDFKTAEKRRRLRMTSARAVRSFQTL